MPRLTQQLPRYTKHKASGHAVVKLGGKLHYLGPFGSSQSKRKYQRIVGEWLTADRNPAPVGAEIGELTIVELLARYMPYAKRHYRKHGELTNEIENIKYAVRPLKTLYGRTHVKDFGPLALKALQVHLIDQGLARTTINARIGIIRRIFRWAVSEQLCPPSVIHGLNAVMGLQAGRTAARETAPVEPVDDSVVEQTVLHLSRGRRGYGAAATTLGLPARGNLHDAACGYRPIDRGVDLSTAIPQDGAPRPHTSDFRWAASPSDPAALFIA